MNGSPPNLQTEFPRSPKETLSGYVHLSRMIDKARAKRAGTLGEYLYPCPLDTLLLDFLAVGAEAFETAAAEADDDGVVSWLLVHGETHSPDEIAQWNERFLGHAPADPAAQERFSILLREVAPHRTDIRTWVDLLDLEENRSVPVRG